jgi:molybdenum cofactor cytidylyltransferase
VPQTGLVVAILGAGRAQRFGAGKLDAALHGKPLGLWPILAARRLGAPIAYVAPPVEPAFLAVMGGQVEVIANPDAAKGMSTSLALAAGWARAAGAGRLLLMLGDMPFVSTTTLHKLVEPTGPGSATACLHPDGVFGPPACFGTALLPELERLQGDIGARKVLAGLAGASGIAVSARELLDIDTPADLEAARALLGPGGQG